MTDQGAAWATEFVSNVKVDEPNVRGTVILKVLIAVLHDKIFWLGNKCGDVAVGCGR